MNPVTYMKTKDESKPPSIGNSDSHYGEVPPLALMTPLHSFRHTFNQLPENFLRKAAYSSRKAEIRRGIDVGRCGIAQSVPKHIRDVLSH